MFLLYLVASVWLHHLSHIPRHGGWQGDVGKRAIKVMHKQAATVNQASAPAGGEDWRYRGLWSNEILLFLAADLKSHLQTLYKR